MIFKKKPLKLEAYAPVGDLAEYFPITPTRDSLPPWYNNIPKHDDNTVKNCMGFRDLMGHGFLIPAWGDFEVKISPNGRAEVETPVIQQGPSFMQHNIAREAPNAWPAYTNVKFNTPWWFYCEEPIKWLVVDPTWHRKDPTQYAIPTGVLEFRYNNQALVNTLWKTQEREYLTKIRAGDALLQLIPVTERPVELELKILTEDIYVAKFAGWAHSFKFGYQKIRAMMDKRK